MTSDFEADLVLFVSTEEASLLSQAALLEQVSNMQPLLDSTYIRGEGHLAGGP